MTRESYTYGLVAGDQQLKDMGVAEVHRSNAIEDPTSDCFIVIVWGTSAPDVGDTRQFVAWVYDTPGDYERVDAVLKRLRTIFSQVGGEVRQYEFTGDSADLFDDRWDRVLRTGSYTAH